MSTSHVVDLAAKILIISIVILSMVIIFVSFVHLYAKWFWNRQQAAPNSRRRRGDFTAGHQEQQSAVTVLRCGLSLSFLETIPVIPFDPNNFKERLECVVCLSEFDEGDKTRVLPKCNHGFHVECIDMWFYSHSTCPICRNSVSDETKISVGNLLESRETQEESTDSQVFPTNVLFWGDETEVSILTSQLEDANNSNNNNNNHGPILSSEAASSSHTIMARPDLVIEIPRLQIDCDEDKKSPISSRVKSLRRILSSSRRFINNPFSINTEQGSRGHL